MKPIHVCNLQVSAAGRRVISVRNLILATATFSLATAALMADTPADSFTFAGRVLSMDGQPVRGARIYVAGLIDEIRFVERTTANEDGSFRFTIRPEEIKPNAIARGGLPGARIFIGAFADGRGATCRSNLKPQERENLTLWLPDEEIAQGQIFDEAGKPIAGVQVRANLMNGALLDANGKPLPYDSEPSRGRLTPATVPTDSSRQKGVTDKDGRVTLRGLSRGWLYQLYVEGPTIVSIHDRLAARKQDAGPFGNNPPRQTVRMITHGSTFKVMTEQCKPIIGTIRESGSSKPIAGVEVRWAPDTGSLSRPHVMTKTDQNGKYTLTGLPHGTHRLNITPPDFTPYAETVYKADCLQAGFDPVEHNIELKRQPAVAGKVVDAASGQPVVGYVHYHPMVSNEHAKNHLNLSERRGLNAGLSAAIGEDGRFFLPVLAGSGVVVVRGGDKYLTTPLSQADREAGYAVKDDPTLINCLPYPLWPEEFQAYQVIDADDEKTIDLDFKLTAGKSRPLIIEFPDGKPAETLVMGLTQRSRMGEAYAAGATTVLGLAEDETRPLVALTRDGKFAATSVVRGKDAGPIAMKLKPCGTIVGRIMDQNGQPAKGSTFQLIYEEDDGHSRAWIRGGMILRFPSKEESQRAAKTGSRTRFDEQEFKYIATSEQADDDGRFQIPGVVPDLPFEMLVVLVSPGADGQRMIRGKSPIANGTVKPGATLDLGELRVGDVVTPAQEKKRDR